MDEGLHGLNAKLLFDEFFKLIVDINQRSRQEYDELAEMHRGQVAALNTLTQQILSNMISTADMVAKQAVRHGDLSIDRQWNLDEIAKYITDEIKKAT